MGKVTNLNKSIGTQYYNNGDRYNGQWKDDMRVGKGTFYYGNGDKFEGAWANDKKGATGKIFT